MITLPLFAIEPVIIEDHPMAKENIDLRAENTALKNENARLHDLLDIAYACLREYCYPIEEGDDVDLILKEIEAQNG